MGMDTYHVNKLDAEIRELKAAIKNLLGLGPFYADFGAEPLYVADAYIDAARLVGLEVDCGELVPKGGN